MFRESKGECLAATEHADNSPPEFRRHIGSDFVIDANRINARGTLPQMCQLERWHRDGVTCIVISNEASAEASHGSSRRYLKTGEYIHTVTHGRAQDEVWLLKAIESVLYPAGARISNHQNDARIVFNAAKYLDILITADGASKTQPGGILGHREKLQALHPTIRIMSDDEAVDFVREKIRERDEQIKRIAGSFLNVQLPSWIGQD